MTRWFSLRRRLLGLLLGGVTVAWLATALFSYFDTHREVDELFDAQMAQVAQTLLAIASHESDENEHIEDMAEDLHRYQRTFSFQIWRGDGALLMRSSHAPAMAMAQSTGFSDYREPGGEWRQYSLWSRDHDLLVQVSEHHHGRDALISRIVWRLMLPALIGLPLIGLWVWLATRRAMRPLDALAEQIGQRAPTQLQALVPVVAPVEIRPLLDSLNDLLARVESALDQERRFTADAAHELRTPLAALQAQLQVALRARDDGERDHSLEVMRQGLVRAAHLVEQMLLLARLDPASGIPDPQAVDLGAVAETVCADLGSRILERQLDFELDCPAACIVWGQREWLYVLIRNLVDNALCYTPIGGQVFVTLGTSTAGECELVVTDSGPGVPFDERERVTRRFYRLHQNDTPGSGLGLAIVSRIVELHGAALSLDENPGGQGLRVTVRWPA